jgi:hypothetical protein
MLLIEGSLMDALGQGSFTLIVNDTSLYRMPSNVPLNLIAWVPASEGEMEDIVNYLEAELIVIKLGNEPPVLVKPV